MPDTYSEFLRNKSDTALNWSVSNPVLLDGEIGIESDTKKIKIGDGASAWNTLSYYISKTLVVDATINGKEITGDVVLTYQDVGAAPAGTYAGAETYNGPATSAAKFATPVTISLSGDATGSASLDGSSTPVNIPVVVSSTTTVTDVDGGTY